MGKDIKQISGKLIFQIGYLIILSLVIWGKTYPYYFNWGVNHFAYLSEKIFYSCIGISLLLFISSYFIKSDKFLYDMNNKVGKINKFVKFIVLSILLFLIFYLLQVKTLLYGDGHSMIGILSSKEFFEFTGQEKFQIVSILFYRFFVNTIISLFSLSALQAIVILNILGGLTAFWAIMFISSVLVDELNEKLIVFVGAISSSSVILFFGYIENYIIPLCLSLWAVYFLIEYYSNRKSVTFPLLFSIAAFLAHAVTIPIILTVFISILLKNARKYKKLLLSNRALIVVVIISFLFRFGYQLLSDSLDRILPYFFLPIYPYEGNNYWFLSILHISDIINGLILMSPVVIILILFKKSGRYRFSALLNWLLVLSFLVFFWLDPMIGALRDFDLLGLLSVPLSIWVLVKFVHNASIKSKSISIVFVILAIISITLIPNLIEKQSIETSLQRLDATLFNDPHYQKEYGGGSRCTSFGWLLENELQDYDRAKKYYWRRLETDNNAALYHALGRMYKKHQDLDSSIICYNKAVKFDSMNCDYRINLALLYYQQNNIIKCINVLKDSKGNCDSVVNFNYFTGIVLCSLSRYDESVYYIRKAYNIYPDNSEYSFNLARVFFLNKEFDSSLVYVNNVLRLNPNNTIAFRYSIINYINLGKRDEAEKQYEKYKIYHPHIRSINDLLR